MTKKRRSRAHASALASVAPSSRVETTVPVSAAQFADVSTIHSLLPSSSLHVFRASLCVIERRGIPLPCNTTFLSFQQRGLLSMWIRQTPLSCILRVTTANDYISLHASTWIFHPTHASPCLPNAYIYTYVHTSTHIKMTARLYGGEVSEEKLAACCCRHLCLFLDRRRRQRLLSGAEAETPFLCMRVDAFLSDFPFSLECMQSVSVSMKIETQWMRSAEKSGECLRQERQQTYGHLFCFSLSSLLMHALANRNISRRRERRTESPPTAAVSAKEKCMRMRIDACMCL